MRHFLDMRRKIWGCPLTSGFLLHKIHRICVHSLRLRRTLAETAHPCITAPRFFNVDSHVALNLLWNHCAPNTARCSRSVHLKIHPRLDLHTANLVVDSFLVRNDLAVPGLMMYVVSLLPLQSPPRQADLCWCTMSWRQGRGQGIRVLVGSKPRRDEDNRSRSARLVEPEVC